MNDIFHYILENYQKQDKVDSRSTLYKVFNFSLVETFTKYCDDMDIKSSVGKGSLALYPWVIIKDKQFKSVHKGLFIMYIFKADMTGFYLTINQGINYLKNITNNDINNIKNITNQFQNNLINNNYKTSDIFLGRVDKDMGYYYTNANILHKYYSKDNLNEKEIVSDLQEFIKIYHDLLNKITPFDYESYVLYKLGKLIPVDKALIKLKDFSLQNNIFDQEIILQDNFEYIEEKINDKLIYNKIMHQKIDKHLLAQKLVLEYEKSLNHEVYWLSDKNDYDIISIDGNSIKKIKVIINNKYKEVNNIQNYLVYNLDEIYPVLVIKK